MRLAIERRSGEAGVTRAVLEVVTPRTNTAALSSAEHLLASIALPEPFSLEVAADAERRQFLVRAASERMRQQLESQLGAAYPQAELRPVQSAADPAETRVDEQVLMRTLHLRDEPYLPIRMFADLDVDGERAAQADPVLGVVSALGDLPPKWRGLSQVVLEPAPEHWGRPYERFGVQDSLAHERIPHPSEGAQSMVAFVAFLLGAIVLGLQGYVLWQAAQWLQLAGLVGVVGLVLGVGLPRVLRWLRPPVYDLDLVHEKLARVAYYTEIRLSIFAPHDADRALMELYLDRLVAAYRRYSLAAGNGFVPHGVRKTVKPDVRDLRPLNSRRRAILTTLELAGMWHLPHAAADVALLERTTARRWLPLPPSVADGCRVGRSVHQGRDVAVALPDDLMRRHMLLVAKTRRGKSTLMLRLAQHVMAAKPPQSMLLVDPHRDLASLALHFVPAERASDVVYLDVADQERPFGLNLLDVGLGWGRDQAVANALTIFEREWGNNFWGPRMEDAFRFALMTLFEANQALCAADPAHGRAAQYTILEVPSTLMDIRFRKEVLRSVTDGAIHRWWTDYYDPLERRFQQELANPVLTKVHRFEANRAVRHIVGQPKSTVNPAAWVRDGRIVIVNTARGLVGENAAALIGSTLLNLVSLGIAAQSELEPEQRQRMTVFVDEFHTIPGADYEGILAELSKYGANLVLATQSLARLAELDRTEGRGLRAVVFANIDGLFAFNCSAEDADYLVPELGGAVDVQDLVELGEHVCYARISAQGERLPAFWLSVDDPRGDGTSSNGEALAAASAARYGRAVTDVEADRRSALARVMASHEIAAARATPDRAEPKPVRNNHRPRKKRKAEPAPVAGV